MKYVLIGIVLFVAAAFVWSLIVKFKWFFITLGILIVTFAILRFFIKKKKVSTAPETEQINNNGLLETAQSTKVSTAPETEQMNNNGLLKTAQSTEEIKQLETKITTYPVKGVFAHEDEIFHNLMEYNAEYDYDKSDLIEFCVPDFPVYKWIPKNLPAVLVPEPDNKYDPNAVRVVVGEYTIGYIPKGNCLEILDVINSGRLENVAYEIHGGAFKLLEEDYDPIKDKSTYSVKTGKAELSAKVYIKVRLSN